MESYKKLFLAIVQSGKLRDWKVEVFLVNPTKSRFEVAQEQGSVQSDEDSRFDLGWGKDGSFSQGPESAHLVDTFNDGGELDFTTTYTFKIKTSLGKVKSLMGSINGWNVFSPQENEYCRTMKKLPVLGIKGIYIKMI